nr:alanine:cation symporter family protein [Bacillus licheniformis]
MQTLGVFFDTMVICSATAFMILLFNLTPGKELDGIQITQATMQRSHWKLGACICRSGDFSVRFQFNRRKLLLW